MPSWISRAGPQATLGIQNRAQVVRKRIRLGANEECAYCRKRVAADAVEFEVEAYVPAGLRTLHFHRVCLPLWEGLLAHEPGVAPVQHM